MKTQHLWTLAAVGLHRSIRHLPNVPQQPTGLGGIMAVNARSIVKVYAGLENHTRWEGLNTAQAAYDDLILDRVQESPRKGRQTPLLRLCPWNHFRSQHHYILLPKTLIPQGSWITPLHILTVDLLMSDQSKQLIPLLRLLLPRPSRRTVCHHRTLASDLTSAVPTG